MHFREKVGWLLNSKMVYCLCRKYVLTGNALRLMSRNLAAPHTQLYMRYQVNRTQGNASLVGTICIQPDKHWLCFEGKLGETPERRGGARMGLFERYDAVLN